MIKSVRETSQFKRDYKRLLKRHVNQDAFKKVFQLLLDEETEILRSSYQDHALKGEWKGYRELHVEKDWLLIYRIVHEELQLVLVRTGSHDNLFR